MPDLKAMNPDDFEQRLREEAQRATARVAEVAERAVLDIRTVAATQGELSLKTATDLLVESRVAMVQEVELREPIEEVRVELGFFGPYGQVHGNLRQAVAGVSPGRYRVLVFLVDAPAAPPVVVVDEDLEDEE